MNLVEADQLCRRRRRAFRPHGGAILRVVIVLALVAIAAGVVFSVLEHGVRDPIAFDEVGPGKIAGNLCTNDLFGFSIEVPETWQALSKRNLAGYLRAQEGSDMLNVAPILVAFKHGEDVPETDAFDPSLIVGAERLSRWRARCLKRCFPPRR